MKLADITRALHDSWSAETGYALEAFSVENPARGQCVVSSLVVQDYFGGDLFRVAAKGEGIDEKHYYNVLDDGTVIDTTRQQYDGMDISLTPAPVDLKHKYVAVREKLLDEGDTKQRYEILKQRVEKAREDDR